MRVINHFELRWVDGYGVVSDAGTELALAIEEHAARLPSSQGSIALAVHDVTGGGSIGLLRLDVVVPSEPRVLRYLHAAMVSRRLDLDGWRALVERRYGRDPEARIRALYEELARSTKERGRDRLDDVAIRTSDASELLGRDRDRGGETSGAAASAIVELPIAGALPSPSSMLAGSPPGGAAPSVARGDDFEVRYRRLRRRFGVVIGGVVAPMAVVNVIALVVARPGPPLVETELRERLDAAEAALATARREAVAAAEERDQVRKELVDVTAARDNAQDRLTRAQNATKKCYDDANVELARKLDEAARKAEKVRLSVEVARDAAIRDREQVRTQLLKERDALRVQLDERDATLRDMCTTSRHKLCPVYK